MAIATGGRETPMLFARVETFPSTFLHDAGPEPGPTSTPRYFPSRATRVVANAGRLVEHQYLKLSEASEMLEAPNGMIRPLSALSESLAIS